MTLTIGTFDGVHLGHQALLKQVDAVVTFSNHPQTILRGEPPEALCSPAHKHLLMEKMGIKHLHFIPFTQEIAKMSAEEFLLQVQGKIPFSHLLLGYDAVIGRNKEGTPEHLAALSQKLGFNLSYIEPLKENGTIISSSQIRRSILSGDLKQASAYLGRPYSILSTVSPGEGKGRAIGFRTANMPLDHLCIPPTGVYFVEARFSNKTLKGIANLGMAPTLQNRTKPTLETHLFDFTEDLYGVDVEIIFKEFIRPEKKFASIEELKAQIAYDISRVKK